MVILVAERFRCGRIAVAEQMNDGLEDTTTQSFDEEFFDSTFLAELEELAESHARLDSGPAAAPHTTLEAFLKAPEPVPQSHPLTEDEFVELPRALLSDRTNTLLEISRQASSGAGRAVESFIVFFQTLIPTLSPQGDSLVRRAFFRIVPTLVHIAYNDFGDDAGKRDEGRAALQSLEHVLIEISSVKLAPMESELVFKSIDQLAGFIGAGEYAVANDVISSQLLSLIQRNKLARGLYRVMEVEVSVQRYLKERLGRTTPRIVLPEDVENLSEYGPLRVFIESSELLGEKRLLEVQVPGIADPKDIVLFLVNDKSGESVRLRLDALGSAVLDVEDGRYSLGLIYEPPD